MRTKLNAHYFHTTESITHNNITLKGQRQSIRWCQNGKAYVFNHRSKNFEGSL